MGFLCARALCYHIVRLMVRTALHITVDPDKTHYGSSVGNVHVTLQNLGSVNHLHVLLLFVLGAFVCIIVLEIWDELEVPSRSCSLSHSHS